MYQFGRIEGAVPAGFLHRPVQAVQSAETEAGTMRIFDKARQIAGSFAGDRSGNFAMLTGVIASMLMLSVGLGVNVAQSYQLKSSLQNALDAAVTSTARDLTTGVIEPEDARKMVEAFLGVNSDAKFATTEQFVLEKLVIDKTARTVEATASANVNLAFPFFSTKDPRVSVSSAAVYSDKTIEVAMMLDVTGSMGGQKIEDLRTAATSAVKALLGSQDQKTPRVRIAIVPYAEAVNTGELASNTVFVEVEGGSNLPPLQEAPIAASTGDRLDNCATERKDKNGKADFSDDGPYTERQNKKGKIYLAKVNRDDRISSNPKTGKTMCPEAALIPLTADKQKLLDTIDKFRADGVTAGGIAAQWGYYMLSPKWRSAIQDAGMGEGPADHNPKKIAKVAILMTDGQFNTAFAGVRDGDKRQGPPQMQQGAKARKYAESLCANMKGDGIEVFTIGFDLNNTEMRKSEKDQAKSVLKNCSSPDTSSVQHYYEAADGEALDAAFDAIIKNIERLALTK
jgi:Flp pilus assembly protein TadG